MAWGMLMGVELDKVYTTGEKKAMTPGLAVKPLSKQRAFTALTLYPFAASLTHLIAFKLRG